MIHSDDQACNQEHAQHEESKNDDSRHHETKSEIAWCCENTTSKSKQVMSMKKCLNRHNYHWCDNVQTDKHTHTWESDSAKYVSWCEDVSQKLSSHLMLQLSAVWTHDKDLLLIL